MLRRRLLQAGMAAVIWGCAGLLSSAGRGKEQLRTIPREQAAADKTELARQEKRERTSKEDQQLRANSKTLRPGVVLFGVVIKADGGPHYHPLASGFVVSKRHRLVATAAHVADNLSKEGQLFAFIDGTSQTYSVKRAWYHPALKRELDKGLYVRSDDPRDGEIAIGRGPDVAVVQLSELGPELPLELDLAESAECEGLEGKRAGLLGYPGNRTVQWPPGAQAPTATFVSCTILRRTEDAPAQGKSDSNLDRRYLWFDIDGYVGRSGCPIFLVNGHVVGVAVGGTDSAAIDGLSWDCGFRSDCLRELLAYHKLDEGRFGTAMSRGKGADWGPDPRLDAFRKAVPLVREADELRRSGKYREALKKCEEALSLAPEHGGALLQRSKVYLYFLGTSWPSLTPEQRLAYVNLAYQDSERCTVLCPDWLEPWLIHSQNMIWSCARRGEVRAISRSAHGVSEMAEESCSVNDQGRARLRIEPPRQSHHFLGELKEAEKDYDESVRLAPPSRAGT